MTRPRLSTTPVWRDVAAISLLAPLSSLLLSRLLSLLVGATGLAASLPSGVHTYAPAVTLVSIDGLAVASAVAAAMGTVLLLRGRRPPGRQQGMLLRSTAILLAAQLLFYLVQAALVAQVQGIADTAPVAVIAVTLQLGALALAGLVLALAPRLLRRPGLLRPTWIRFSSLPAVVAGHPQRAHRRPLAVPHRRGPPPSLRFA